MRTGWRLAQHVWRVWRTGQVRFRLETFGLYYPAAPYEAPWWRVSPAHSLLFLRRLKSYADWVVELEKIRRDGPSGYWDIRRQSADRNEP